MAGQPSDFPFVATWVSAGWDLEVGVDRLVALVEPAVADAMSTRRRPPSVRE